MSVLEQFKELDKEAEKLEQNNHVRDIRQIIQCAIHLLTHHDAHGDTWWDAMVKRTRARLYRIVP